MPTRHRLKTPLVLALLGVGLLIGCIPIPIYRKREHPDAFIGAAGSSRPVKLGRTVRVELRPLLPMLGQPDPALSQGNALVFTYSVGTVWLAPFCGVVEGDRYLRLEFDDQGVLRRYKVLDSRKDAGRPLRSR
jgi:hypothetical protein